MPLEVFQGIHNTSWICCNCGLPNFSTTLFETFLMDSLPTQNTYSQLSDGDSHQDSLSSPQPSCTSSESFSSLDSSIGIPQHTSSPNKPSQTASVKPCQNTLRVLTVNFQSMKAKKTSFWLLLTETNPDIVIGCETWLHPGIYEREVLPENYHIVARKDRSSDHHGGVLIAAKDTLIGTHLDIQTNTEFAAASFTCQGHAPLIIRSIYRPPNSEQDYMEELCDKIRQLQTSNPRASLWISGDVNLPDIDWETHTIKGHNYPISINQCFLNTIYDTGSDQIVRFPTRGENILDVFLTNHPSLIEKCKAVPGVSDHDIVFVEASTRATRTKQPQRKIYLWKHVDIEEKKPDVLDFSTRFTTQYSASTGVTNCGIH